MTKVSIKFNLYQIIWFFIITGFSIYMWGWWILLPLFLVQIKIK